MINVYFRKKKKILFIIFLFITIYTIIGTNVGIYKVEGTSMENTLYDGDIVIVLKNAQIENRDIIVCETSELYLEDEYIIKRYYEEKSISGLYLLGDNVSNSVDSRHFGEVPKYACKGEVVLIISLKNGIIRP